MGSSDKNSKYLLEKSFGQVLLKRVYEIIFPRKCLFCDKVLDLAFEISCDGCRGLYLRDFVRLSRDFTFDAYSACDYGDKLVSQAVIRFKYVGNKYLAGSMAEVIYKSFGMIDADMLVCVPLHKSRLAERGYNQSALLAMELGSVMGLPAYDGLIRTRRTKKQFDLNPNERILNVLGAFDLQKDFCVRGKNVMLVDDILTTGVTAAECIRVLSEAGALSAGLITFAVTSPFADKTFA